MITELNALRPNNKFFFVLVCGLRGQRGCDGSHSRANSEG